MRKQQMWFTLTKAFSNVFTPPCSWCRGCSRCLTCCWWSTAASTSPSTTWRGAAPGDTQYRSWARGPGRRWTPGGTPDPAKAKTLVWRSHLYPLQGNGMDSESRTCKYFALKRTRSKIFCHISLCHTLGYQYFALSIRVCSIFTLTEAGYLFFCYRHIKCRQF